jgi:NADH-quinone oxidoreductase subunit G
LVALGLLNVALGKKSLPGVNEFRASVAQYTPAHVSELTGVPGEVIVDLAQALLGAENVIFAFGAEGAPEALAQHLANLAVITGHVGRPNNGLLPVWPHANTQGALDVIADCGLRIADLPPISNLQSPILYILGADPVSNGEALPEGAFVICHELFLTETARRANVIFPAQSWAERDGTFTNAERRVQRFYKALPPLDGTLADWEILRNIAHKLGLDWNYQSSEEIMRELIANAPRYAGLTYARLAQTEPQWPPVGNSDLYFGGTACQNHGGLGAQLPAECEAMEQYEVRWVEPEVAPIRSRRLYQRGTLIAASPVLKRRLTNNK